MTPGSVRAQSLPLDPQQQFTLAELLKKATPRAGSFDSHLRARARAREGMAEDDLALLRP